MLLNNALIVGRDRLLSIRWVHHLESLGLAFTLMFVLSAAILNFRLDSAIHEWANFLHHYDLAPPAARRPVEIFLMITFVILFIVVEALRSGRRYRKTGQVKA